MRAPRPRPPTNAGAVRRRARRVALACLLAIGCGSGPGERARIERDLAAAAAQALGAHDVSAACTRLPDGHHACVVAAPGRGPFVAHVQGRGDDGALAWRALGVANIELVIARGVAQQLGVAATSARCPRAGCVGDGFECAVTLADGTEIPVAISPADGDRFRWQTRGVIASDGVESLIRGRLGASRPDARVDCGPRLRASRPGTTFSCAIAPASATGAADSVEIRVLDWSGRVNVGTVPGADADSADPDGADGAGAPGASSPL